MTTIELAVNRIEEEINQVEMELSRTDLSKELRWYYEEWKTTLTMIKPVLTTYSTDFAVLFEYVISSRIAGEC